MGEGSRRKGGIAVIGAAIFLIALAAVAAFSGRFLGRYRDLRENEVPDAEGVLPFALDAILFSLGGLLLALGVVLVLAAGGRGRR